MQDSDASRVADAISGSVARNTPAWYHRPDPPDAFAPPAPARHRDRATEPAPPAPPPPPPPPGATATTAAAGRPSLPTTAPHGYASLVAAGGRGRSPLSAGERFSPAAPAVPPPAPPPPASWAATRRGGAASLRRHRPRRSPRAPAPQLPSPPCRNTALCRPRHRHPRPRTLAANCRFACLRLRRPIPHSRPARGRRRGLFTGPPPPRPPQPPHLAVQEGRRRRPAELAPTSGDLAVAQSHLPHCCRSRFTQLPPPAPMATPAMVRDVVVTGSGRAQQAAGSRRDIPMSACRRPADDRPPTRSEAAAAAWLRGEGDKGTG